MSTEARVVSKLTMGTQHEVGQTTRTSQNRSSGVRRRAFFEIEEYSLLTPNVSHLVVVQSEEE